MRINLIAITLLASCLHLYGLGYGQSISLSVKDASLEKVIDQIEKQSDYTFWLQEDLLGKSTGITLSLKNAPLETALNELFKGQPLDYTIIDKTIVIRARQYRPSSLPPGAGRQSADKNGRGHDYMTRLDKLVAGQTPQKERLQFSVSGKVTDESGEGLPGVNILEKGTGNGTSTDESGEFNLSVNSASAILVVSFIGYESQEIALEGRETIPVTLLQDVASLEEVVVVGYGEQKRGNVTGAISTLQGKDLTQAPIASTTNSLTGRIPGLISVQSSGQPGADAAMLSIRGFGNPLIIVDGVERSLNTINANEIESISVLKDGSSSIYGSRAGNGVILVTTKRGNFGKPVITFETSRMLQTVTSMLEAPSSGQYTEMESESWLQAGRPADQVPYTPEEIQKYYDGTDSQYPNTNWHDEVIRKWSPQQNYHMSVRGGSEKIKYYGFLGYLDQQSMWKDNGGGYKRYNFKTNIDAQIQPNLFLQMNLTSIVEDRDRSARSQGIGGGMWQDYWTTRPIYPATLPDPSKISYAGNDVGGVHASSNSDIFGYNRNDNQLIEGTISLNYTFNHIKGLSAKGFMNYSQSYSTDKTFNKPAQFYTYDYASDTYTLAGARGEKATLDISKNQGRALTGQLSVNYDRIIAGSHHLQAMALYETIDYSNDWVSASRIDFLSTVVDQMYAGSINGMSNNGSASEMGRKSFLGRVTYSFKDKYLADLIFRADASAKFPPGKRWGYFPSLSLGWVLTNEPFMETSGDISHLKLRASYGASGNDGVGNFQYLSGYSLANNYVFGASSAISGLRSTGLPNPNLTWEEIQIYNIGLDFALWGRKLYGEGDVFYRERQGIPGNRLSSLPSSFGSSLPPENLNSLSDRGFELRLGTAGKSREFSWDLSGNISWSRAKWIYLEEPVYEDPDQERINKRSGRWTDIQFGYLSDGLFTSMEEINALEFDQDEQGNATLRPGDIRYRDLNGDGKLDWKDRGEIGKGTTPHWMMGFNLSFSYKNFYLSSLWQGAMGYYKNVILTYKIGNLMRPGIIYDLRWTEENNDPGALEPRLGGAETNDLVSDYRYRKAGYMRLKLLSVGYNVPEVWLSKFNISNLNIYLSGTNLLTLDKLKKYGIDPEAPSGHQQATFYYPQQKTLTLGLSISL